MKKFIYFLIIPVLLGSCRTSKIEEDNRDIQKIDSTTFIKHDSIQKETIRNLSKELIIVKDSLIQVKALKESSQNIVTDKDTSRLETSYANSTAWIDSTGKLHHKIWNKDLIPTNQKIIYINKESNNDSISNKNDNKEKNIIKNSDKEKQLNKTIYLKPSLKDKISYFLYGIITGLILLIFIKLGYKYIKIKYKI